MTPFASELPASIKRAFKRIRSRWGLAFRRRPWLALLLGVGLSLLWLLLGGDLGTVGPIVATDLEQQRSDTVLPPPQGDVSVSQSFTPRWDGLREIEILFARQGEPDAAEQTHLRLELVEDSGDVVAHEELATRSLAHNQVYAFRFTPVEHSAGRRFLLRLSGDEGNPVSVWGYSLDIFQGETLTLYGAAADSAARELRFVTRYQLTVSDAMIALLTMLSRDGLILLLGLFFLPLPGVLILLAGVRSSRSWDPAAWWGTALAIGVGTWPLLWYGLTLLGGRWSSWSLWTVLLVGWGTAAVIWRQRRVADMVRDSGLQRGRRWKRVHAWLFALLLASLAVRLLAVRDLQFPPWVDSSRHALITAVMAESGRAPLNYEPYLPVDRFPYHYGFHTLSASLSLMTHWPLHRLLLMLGQLLNGLVPLTIYAGVQLLTRRRWTGMLAAFLVAFPFFFPGYYATWGRMTQLAAMLLMPLLLALTWLLVRGGRRWRHCWWVLALLVAGLFLLHFRVFLYFLPFVAVVWLMSKGRNGRWLASAAGLAFVLLVPRIVQLAAITDPVKTLGIRLPNYNVFPSSYVQVGWEAGFLWLAAAGLLMSLINGLLRKRGAALRLALVGWIGLLFDLLAGEAIGLPESSVVNLNSMYIIVFLPLSIFLADSASGLWAWSRRGAWLLQSAIYSVTGFGLAVALLFGVRQQIGILNPQTVLARPADLRAIEWLDQNAPETAYVAVNSWLWLGNSWAGSDGGAWLVPLTRRLTTTPPADYIYSAALSERVTRFNEAAVAIENWAAPEAAAWLAEQGVTHIYVGPRGGFFDPAALEQNPNVNMVYGRDGAFIFSLDVRE